MSDLPAALQGIQHTTYLDRNAWLLSRAESIGASDMAVLFDSHPYQSEFVLFHSKANPRGEQTVDLSSDLGQRLLLGTLLEPGIAQAYATMTGRTLEDVGHLTVFRDAQAPMTATLDFVIPEAEGKDGPGVMEAKNTGDFAYRRLWNEDVPLMYVIQLQAQLAVTGLKWGSICVCAGGSRLRWFDFDSDPELHRDMRARATAFMERLAAGEEPEPDESEDARRVLLERFPQAEEGLTVIQPATATQLWQEIRDAQDAIKEAERIISANKNRLLKVHGNAQYSIIPDVGRISRSEVAPRDVSYTRKGYTNISLPQKADPDKAARMIEELEG